MKDYLEDATDSRLDQATVDEFLNKLKIGTASPTDVMCIYTKLSWAAQNQFLKNIKPLFTNEEYIQLLMYFKSLSYMDPARRQSAYLKEYLGLALYEYFNKHAE